MIIVCGRTELREHLERVPAAVVLSFRDVTFDPSRPDLNGAQAVHEWQFDDAWRKSQSDARLPVRADIQRIVDLADQVRESRLIIHCNNGINRSAAAAFILFCCWNPPGTEADQLTALRCIRPEAIGNPLMIWLADEVLNRSGRMVEAFLDDRYSRKGRDPGRIVSALALPPDSGSSLTGRAVARWLTF